MTLTSKREVAGILRQEAQNLRRHGFTNFFSHQFACLMAQVLRPEQCEGCVLADFLPEEYAREAFPCQHFDQATWERIAQIPGLPEKVAVRFLAIAEGLETQAEVEAVAPRPARGEPARP